MLTVYIVRCADGTLYTGYARDLEQRCAAHNAGKGARYTATRRPVTVVYSEPCATVSEALKREYALKQLTRAEKEALIARPPRGGLPRRSASTGRRRR